MYFDLEPKSKREDLYDFDEQFEKLAALLKESRARAPRAIVAYFTKPLRTAGFRVNFFSKRA